MTAPTVSKAPMGPMGPTAPVASGRRSLSHS